MQQVRGSEAARIGRQHVFAINSAPAFLNLLQEERSNVTTTTSRRCAATS